MPYNVLIVEDQEMPKQLFEIFVNSSENYVHVASLSDASLAPTVCRTRKVDLVLMDVCTAQNSSGLDAAEQIKKRSTVGQNHYCYFHARIFVDQTSKRNRGGFVLV